MPRPVSRSAATSGVTPDATVLRTDLPPPIPELAADYQLRCNRSLERALPIRQGDLNRLLLAEPGLTPEDQAQFTCFGRMLGAFLHGLFYSRLRELKELYAPLDPDSDFICLGEYSKKRTEDCDEEFLAPFEAAMDRANYRPLELHVIEEAISAPNEIGLTYVPDFSLFEHLRVWVRGYTQIQRECRTANTLFRKRTVRLDAYQRMVIALKFKRNKKIGNTVRSDVVYLKMFKDVPHVDLEMHLPEQGTKVRMRWIDKAQIASPLAIGIPTLAFKIVLGLTTPFAIGALIAPVSAGVNSIFGFFRAKKNHLSAMIQRLYYLTLANNASVITRVIDSAEDEEYKEAMLAYFFLWRVRTSGEMVNLRRLDDIIEAYLKEKTGIVINFEVADALSKLLRLGLARRDPTGHLHVLPLDEAIAKLEHHWRENTPWRTPVPAPPASPQA